MICTLFLGDLPLAGVLFGDIQTSPPPQSERTAARSSTAKTQGALTPASPTRAVQKEAQPMAPEEAYVSDVRSIEGLLRKKTA